MGMNDLYSRIVADRGSMERLVERLPGFGGYMEMSGRRKADRMMRDHIANQLQQQISRLARIEKMLLDEGGLRYMTKTRSAKTKFQTFIDRIKTSSPGHSGFFDAVKIEADDLEVIYAFDQALLDYVTKFGLELDALEQAAQQNVGVEEAIASLDALTIEANEAYNLRENVLNGIE